MLPKGGSPRELPDMQAVVRVCMLVTVNRSVWAGSSAADLLWKVFCSAALSLKQIALKFVSATLSVS